MSNLGLLEITEWEPCLKATSFSKTLFSLKQTHYIMF